MTHAPQHVASLVETKASSRVIFPQAQHHVSKKYCQTSFGVSYPPVIRVAPGDLVHVETNDCFHGKIHPNNENSADVLETMARDEFNPVTGPIYVEGAMPGDMLAVRLLDIKPEGVGVACCGPHAGQLQHWMAPDTTTTRFFDLSTKTSTNNNAEEQPQEQWVTMRDALENNNNNNNNNIDTLKRNKQRNTRIAPISFPASPMLGVIGVAPAGSSSILTMPAGNHGGNLDNNCNGIGSTVYLPVNHPGALLSIGDMHASQGDGEISGNGVEVGGHVLLQCEIIQQEDLYGPSSDTDEKCHTLANGVSIPSLKLEYPVTETPTHWITHGVLEESIPQTTVVACEEAAKLLVGQWGFSPEEAFIFLSVRGNLGLCQSCHPDQGTQIAKMSVPKLDVCPRPFRIQDEL